MSETDYSKILPAVARVSKHMRKDLIEELDTVIIGVQRYMGEMPEGKSAYFKLREVRKALGNRKYTVEAEDGIDKAFFEVKKILLGVSVDYINSTQPFKHSTKKELRMRDRVVSVYDGFNSLYREWYGSLHGVLQLHKVVIDEFKKEEKKFRKEGR